MDIKDLIPQREPMIMVDSFEEISSGECVSSLTVREDNVFCRDGRLAVPGVIEHVAQTAAAREGMSAWKNGEPPRIGVIGEIKKFSFSGRLPACGETISTKLKVLGSAADVTLVAAESRVCGELVAEGRLKLAMRG